MICDYCNNNFFFYTKTMCCNKNICNSCKLKGNDDLCYNCGNDKFSKYYNTELNKLNNNGFNQLNNNGFNQQSTNHSFYQLNNNGFGKLNKNNK